MKKYDCALCGGSGTVPILLGLVRKNCPVCEEVDKRLTRVTEKMLACITPPKFTTTRPRIKWDGYEWVWYSPIWQGEKAGGYKVGNAVNRGRIPSLAYSRWLNNVRINKYEIK